MISHKKWWVGLGYPGAYAREGWFLFGFVPLYLRDLGLRDKR